MELTRNEEKMLSYFSRRFHLDHMDQLKLVYGWKLLISDLKKLIVVYMVAFLLDCIVATFIMHLSFYTIRQVAYGMHSRSFWLCTVVSCVAFPIFSYVIIDLEITRVLSLALYVASMIPLLLFAPIGTSVNQIRSKKHRNYLRKKMKTRLIILALCLPFLPVSITKYIVAGVMIENMSIILSILLKGAGK